MPFPSGVPALLCGGTCIASGWVTALRSSSSCACLLSSLWSRTYLAHVDLVLQLKVSLGSASPNYGCGSGQSSQYTLEEFCVIVRRQNVPLGQLRHFLDQAVDLLAGFFNQMDVGLRLRSCAHRVDLIYYDVVEQIRETKIMGTGSESSMCLSPLF